LRRFPFYETARALDNVIFCRTFSKWAALAGMRVGYCIAHPTFVTTMMAVKQPYNIPVCSLVAKSQYGL
jgi:histidinol-phosphate aminotransferase